MLKLIKVEKNGCMPCKKLDQILSNLQIDNVEHKNIDEEDCSQLIEKYNIESTPALIKIHDDNLFDVLHGINHTMSEFKAFLELESGEFHDSKQTGCENGCCSL